MDARYNLTAYVAAARAHGVATQKGDGEGANERYDELMEALRGPSRLAYHRTGHTETAIETQRKALSLPPEDSSIRVELEKRLAEFEAARKEPDR